MDRIKSQSLIVIGGFAGSGKTTVSRELSRRLRIPRIGIDSLARAVDKKQFNGEIWDKRYPIAYAVSYKLAQSLLKDGLSVILDNNMCNPLSWDNFEKLAKDNKDTALAVIILNAPWPVCVERVEKRRREKPGYYEIGKDNIGGMRYKYDFIQDKLAENLNYVRCVATERKSINQIISQVTEMVLSYE